MVHNASGRLNLTRRRTPHQDEVGSAPPLARLIAFYLPQFHPIPENDRWWGTGFTEWINVARSRPLFRGHDQPRIPADLGFYDLRSPESRMAQADMARRFGIEAFCYWHYWFGGKRLLERPFDEVLSSGEPNFSFCLAWANEDWTRTWLGTGEVLQSQTYSSRDYVEHAQWLIAAFSDRRYLTVHGRPLFLIYRPSFLPDPNRATDTIRDVCVQAGVAEPYLLGMNGWNRTRDFRLDGFDGTLDFQPQLGDLPLHNGPTLGTFKRNVRLGVPSARLKVFDYETSRRVMTRGRDALPFPVYPSLFVGWDNSPRRGRDGVILLRSEGQFLAGGLQELIGKAKGRPFDERLVFLNAWNEWAEGNYLEPDMSTGLSRLEAIAEAVGVGVRTSSGEHYRLP